MIWNYEDELEPEFVEILEKDDVGRFKWFVDNELGGDYSKDVYTYCVEYEAVNITLAMLRGECNKDGYPPAINRNSLCDSLGLANPEVIKLLIERCGAAYQCNVQLGPLKIVPLDLVLMDIRYFSYKLLKCTWYPEESFVKLIMLLCQPAMKPQLECVRLVADHTNSFSKLARVYLLCGMLVELAGLLIVHHKKAMAAFGSGGKIKQPKCLMPSDKLPEDDNNERINAWSKAVGLLNIFEKAGVKLSQLFQSLQGEAPPNEVIIQVAKVIQEAGFAVKHKDIVDLTDFYRFEPEVKVSMFAKLGFEMEGTSYEEKHVFPSDFPYKHGFKGGLYGLMHQPNKKFCTPFCPDHIRHQRRRLFSTAPNCSRNCSGASRSARGIAYLAMKLKKGTRFL